MPPPDPEDDAALIERSWHDPEAFAGLYDRHAAPLHRYAARRLGAGAADDIVADTFLDAFRKRLATTSPSPTPAPGCTASPRT
jgi:RNA polymerase sigma-70 factor, ECF subfamily